MTPATPTPLAPPAIIVYGRDEAGRPHASAFAVEETSQAEHAAGLMGMAVLSLGESQLDLATQVPRGRLFESGKAFVPFVRAGLYDELVAVGGEPGQVTATVPLSGATKAAGGQGGGSVPDQGGGAPGKPGEADKPPFDWGSLHVGSVVLATDDDPTHWYVAEVKSVMTDDRFELTWRDWPDEPRFQRQREDLALFHPGWQWAES